MKTDKFQNKYRIPSARAVWHDYNDGDYFITICTKNREHYFGEVCNNSMVYNDAGHKMNELIQNIEQHHSYAQLAEYQVMPNHVHLIVVINENKRIDSDKTGNVDGVGNDDGTGNVDGMTRYVDGGTGCDGGTRYADTGHADTGHVETGHAPSLQKKPKQPQQSQQPTPEKSLSIQDKMKLISEKKGLLSVVMGNLKSAMTKYSNDNNIVFEWQERFHDHIIRDRDEYNRIAVYIENNPLLWKDDKFYTE